MLLSEPIEIELREHNVLYITMYLHVNKIKTNKEFPRFIDKHYLSIIKSVELKCYKENTLIDKSTFCNYSRAIESELKFNYYCSYENTYDENNHNENNHNENTYNLILTPYLKLDYTKHCDKFNIIINFNEIENIILYEKEIIFSKSDIIFSYTLYDSNNNIILPPFVFSKFDYDD